MTAKSLLTALLPLVSDLSRELPEGERYRRLLEAMRALLPCDAAALLRLDGEWLVPLAVDGLSTDTLGRRFKVSEHPRFAVLLARIRAQLRQHEASEDAVFSVGPYSFRPGSKMLTGANARKVRLTEKETAILRFLYRAGQMPVSRETLLQEVWGYNSGVTTHTLETHIYRLRQKIEPEPGQARLLLTDAGGYRLQP